DRATDVTGNALHFRIVETVDDDAIVRAEHAKTSGHLAGGAALRPAPDPADEAEHDQHHDQSHHSSELLHEGLQRICRTAMLRPLPGEAILRAHFRRDSARSRGEYSHATP